jgi:RNA polymerase sigma factor (sigma-70 family)
VQQSNQKTDADLLKEISGSGNHAAFAALAERHGPMVHAVALRVLSNHHDAEDVTQAVFLALWRHAAKLSRQPSVAGWLHTVSRRLALDTHRSRQSRQRREQATMKEERTATPDATLRADLRRELDAALNLLPDRYRQPLIIFHLEGASLHEVALRLDLNPSTLRTNLSRAREMLRQLLSRRGIEVASIGVLGSLFTSEAQAGTLPSSLLSTVVNNATDNGATVAPHIMQLADKAASVSATTSFSSLTTCFILMNTKAILITVAVIALATIGTTAYVIRQGNEGPGTEPQNTDRPNVVSPPKVVGPLKPAEHQSAKIEPRASKFQSIDEAEQALLEFDLMPIMGNKKEDVDECLQRYQSLTTRIPESYFSELASRLGGLTKNGLAARSGGQSIQQFLRHIFLYQEWGRINFEAALADLSNIEEKKTQLKALNRVFAGALDADPLGVMKKAQIVEFEAPHKFEDLERLDLMDTIFDRWIQFDPSNALEWAKQAEVPAKRRDQWIADGIRVWEKQDPAAAAKWRNQ